MKMPGVWSDYPEHLARRPTWACRACGEEWPCEQRRAELLFHCGNDRPWLIMYMGIYLVDAVVDLDPPREKLNPLVRRFLGWLLEPAAVPHEDDRIKAMLVRLRIAPKDVRG